MKCVSSYRLLTSVTLLIGALIVLSPTLAFGQSPTPEERIQALVDQSLDHYDTLQLEDAVRVLEEAVGVAEQNAVHGEALADVHMMLGIVEHALYADPEITIQRFVDGLLEAPEAVLNPYYTNPELEALLAAARERVPNQTIEPPEELLTHAPPVTVRAGQPLTVTASIPGGAGVHRIVLGYRAHGQTRYHLSNMMLSSPTEFYATVPGSFTEDAGLQVEYFLQAVGPDDRILATSATPNAPHTVVILDGDGPETGNAINEVIAIALGVGSGGGLATGEPLVMGGRVDLNPGVALTPLHFFADIGFYFADAFQFGPFLRLQTVLLENGVELEIIVGGKLKWYFLLDGPTRMYASFGGGWGHIRHTVDLSPTVEFVDTTREGPFHGGVGFGYAYFFTDNVGLLVDVYSMVLFDELSVQLDLNVGLLLSF